MRENNPNKPDKIYGIKESVKNGLAPYIAVNFYGNRIQINPKNRNNHSSVFEAQEDSHVFCNLGLVLAIPDKSYPSHSKTTKAQAALENGDVIIYEKYNYYESITIVGYCKDNVVFVKIEEASKYFGREIEDLSKNDIIKHLKLTYA